MKAKPRIFTRGAIFRHKNDASSKKAYPQVIIAGLIAALWMTLGYSAFQARAGGYPQWVALPASTGASVSFAQLDEINENHPVLITYETLSDIAVEAAGQTHRLQAVYVNHAYPYVMGYSVLNGGFFSRDAQESGLAHVTLNKTAAFALLGSIDIAGCRLTLNRTPCIVTGVIDDGDAENSRLYAPPTLGEADMRAEGVIARVWDSASAQVIANALKEGGVTEAAYHFYHLNEYRQTLEDKWTLSMGIMALALLGRAFQRGISQALNYNRRRNEAVRSHASTGAAKFVLAWGAFCLATGASMAVLGRFLLPLAMHWHDYPTPAVWSSPVMQNAIRALHGLGVASDGGFIGLCVLTVLFWAFSLQDGSQAKLNDAHVRFINRQNAQALEGRCLKTTSQGDASP